MEEIDAHEIIVDFGKICRLCLSEDGILISAFTKDFILDCENGLISDIILDLMSIKLEEDDGFPPWICQNCLSQLNNFYKFSNMCKNTQITLNKSFFTALSDAGLNIITYKNEDDMSQELEKSPDDDNISIIYANEDEVNIATDIDANLEGEIEDLEDIDIDIEEEASKETEGKYFCGDCSTLFLCSNDYFIHRISAHHDDLDSDSEKTAKNEKIEEKAEQDTATGLWTCDPCGAKFHSKTAITTHIRFKHLNADTELDFHLKKLTFCKYCGLSFNRKNLNRHLEVIHRITKNLESDQRDIGSFDCRICYRPFMRHSSLRNHIEKFHGENLEIIAEAENCEIVWNCAECDSVFLEEVNLIQHYGNKHSKYPLEMDGLRGLKSKDFICSCGVVNLNFFDTSLHSIFYHETGENSKNGIECPGCGKRFPQVEELKIHLISYHWFTSMSYENECVFCNFSFDTNDDLRIHLNKNHSISFEKNPLEEKFNNRKNDEENGETSAEEKEESIKNNAIIEKPYTCEDCEDCFQTEEELQAHKNTSHLSHVCKLCGKEYKSENHLKRHVTEYHDTMSPIKCPLCPKVFPRKMNLHNHYKRRHLKLTKKFVCSYCGEALKGKVSLKSHEDRLHRNIRSYKCTECPEAFTTRSILRKHAQRHLSERPMLQCQYCEQKFSTISGLERHIKKHEGVKEFACDVPQCEKSFYTKSELRRHKKFHTKDFKHVCPICNHKFMSPGELKKHSTKHTGERPFKCHLCSCAYARRDDKVKHLKRVHNLKVKRVYGKPLKKNSDNDKDLLDTIVIDETCNETTPESNEVHP